MLRSKDEIRTLTGLRGVAALWVFSHHFQVFFGQGFLWPGGRGYLGVDLFFILSGYVLSHRYLGPGSKPFRYGDFILKRLARLYPVYLSCHLLYFAVYVGVWAAGISPWNAVYGDPWQYIIQIPLLQGLGLLKHQAGNHIAWSVSAEWLAYLTLFPLVAALFKRPLGRAWLGLATGLGFLLLFAYAAHAHGGRLVMTREGALRILPSFLLGALAWAWRARWQAARADALALLGLVVAGLWLALTKGLEPLVLLPFAAIILGLGGQGPVSRRLLAGPVMVFLGRISYSFYLSHLALLGGLRESLPHILAADPGRLVTASLALGLELCLAWALWRWVEEPARRWIVHRYTLLDPH